MKKKFIVCFCFLMSCFCLHANNIKSLEISVESSNLKKDEVSWLGRFVADKLESNLAKYTDLVVVNTTNKDDIYESQRRNEDAIEVGKLKNASHAIFLRITKAKSNYIISATVTNLTTRENIAKAISQPRRKSEDLYTGHGCAIDEITIQLCDGLNIDLGFRKKIIMEGEESLNDSEKSLLYNSDIELYNKKINNLKRELNSISSTSMEDAAKKKALEASMAETEEKLKLAKVKKERSIIENQKKKRDEEKNRNRSNSQMEKINNKTEELNEILDELKKKKEEDISLLEAVNHIELKKSKYLEAKTKVTNDLAEMQNDIDEKIADKIKEIDKREFRNAEMVNGEPTAAALANREEEKQDAIDKIYAEDGKDMEKFSKDMKKIIVNVKKEIEQGYKNIKPKTITTLNDELDVAYGAYDGSKGGWPLSVTVQIDDTLLLQTTSFLSIEDVAGISPVKYTEENAEQFQNFADTVDYYDSLFSNGNQILTFALDYDMSPMDKNHPSKYLIEFDNFRFYETKKVSVSNNSISSRPKAYLNLDEKTAEKQYYPVNDMRSQEEIDEYERVEAKRRRDLEAAERERERQEELKEQKRIENEEKAKHREEKVSEMKDDINYFFDDVGNKFNEALDYHASTADSSLLGISFEAMGGDVIGNGFEILYTYGVNEKLFFGYALNVLFSDNSYYLGLTKDNRGTLLDNIFSVGYKHSLEYLFDMFGFYPSWDVFSCPQTSYSVGLGFDVCFPEVTDISGDFAIELESAIETRILDTVSIISNIEIAFGFGNQKATGKSAFGRVHWNIGAGYRF